MGGIDRDIEWTGQGGYFSVAKRKSDLEVQSNQWVLKLGCAIDLTQMAVTHNVHVQRGHPKEATFFDPQHPTLIWRTNTPGG